MNPRFAAYLKNIPTFFKQTKKDIILENIKSRVADAETGLVSQLGRVFNEFPLSYEINHEIFFAFEPQELEKLIKKTEALINLNHCEFWEEQGPKVIVSPDTEAEIKDILSIMIDQACQSLLVPKEIFHSEVIQFFNLQQLLDNNKNNIHVLHEIVFEIVYSYCAQIINANLTDIFCNQKKLNIGQVDMFNTKCREFYASTITTYNSLFSPFLQNIVFNYLYGEMVFTSENFMSYLGTINNTDIVQMVKEDFIVESENDKDTKLTSLIYKNKIELWFCFLEYLKNKQEMVLHQAIFKALPKDLQSRWENSPKGFPQLNKHEMKAWHDSLSEEKSNHHEEGSAATSAKLKSMCFSRDNIAFLDFIFKKIHAEKNALLGDLKKIFKNYLPNEMIDKMLDDVAVELYNAQFNFNLISQDTYVFIENVFHKSKQKSALGFLFAKYFPELRQRLALNSSFESKGIVEAMQATDWDLTISILINIKLHDLSVNELKMIQESCDKLIHEFLNFLRKRNLTAEERIELINNVIDDKNALSAATKSSGVLHWAAAVLNKKRRTKSLETLHEYKEELLQKDGWVMVPR